MSDIASGAVQGASLGTSIMPGWGTLIGGVAGGVGGILSAKAKQKAENRKLEQEKSMNRIEIEQNKSEVQKGLISNLAASLAATIARGQ